jgi:hypothetical protein
VIAIIDLKDNSGYSLSAQQTPAELQQQAKEGSFQKSELSDGLTTAARLQNRT